jgi:signal peptidase I
MSKRKAVVKPGRAPAVAGIDRPERVKAKTPRPAEPPEKHGLSRSAVRETVESVVIAFVLAFLFRTFEAEAFVIPTGSMATTLMGRHKDLECPACGHKFQVSTSDEVTAEGADKGLSYRVESCTCPMCRRPINVGNSRDYPPFKGDRILVGKFAYQFRDPERWDVAVFHYPGEAQTNYIKRVVGLPGETIRIRQGDVYVKRLGDADFAIARKANKLRAMLQPVYDNDLTPKIKAKGFPARWSAWPSADRSPAGAWQAIDDDCGFETAGAAKERWIRYEHRVPTAQQWRNAIEYGNAPGPNEVKPALISDFSGYNTDVSQETAQRTLPLHWVGDLALEATLEVTSDEGQIILELVKGGRRFQCRFDVGSGDATLSIGGNGSFQVDEQEFEFAPTAKTKVCGRGTHEVLFANCDQQLRLWVDGSEVPFDGSYPPLDNLLPTADDMAPAGIGSLGAGLRVSHLKLLRDVYYTTYLPIKRLPHGMTVHAPDERIEAPGFTEEQLRIWQTCAAEIDPRLHADYELDSDQFFMLGDNSPKSRDSRAWGDEYFVRRELLIGKAFFIYWPHSWNVPVPFWPNFRRMGFVR